MSDIADSPAGDDLFGDEEASNSPRSNRGKLLDDEDLASDASGDHGGRGYSRENPASGSQEVREKVIMGIELHRHRVPKPKDKVLRSLRVPPFLKFIPEEYNPETFEPSEFDVENSRDENPKEVVRFSQDAETFELKSNAVIYKWDDGSTTLSVGGEHYELQSKSMAPPLKGPYREQQDSHYYAAAAEISSNVLMMVGHIAEQHTVVPNQDSEDHALTKLAERMREAAKAKEVDIAIHITENPTLERKKAEMAEREQLKAQRRREAAQAREDRGSTRYSNRNALSVGDLEGGRRSTGGASGRKRAAPGTSKPKRRKPDYDSDDDLPQGSHRQEEYDADGGFIVGSDEEIEEDGGDDDDDDDDDLLDDEDEEEAPPRSKRRKETARSDNDEDEDESDGGRRGRAADASGRSRRRNVVDDDDE